mmetsp:Transcript_25962/g.61603  ORF Transcript_25962/g.61603 Transcript_25962/m.61603 type:complete len:460 (-) Transcript_25962:1298-2677(-)
MKYHHQHHASPNPNGVIASDGRNSTKAPGLLRAIVHMTLIVSVTWMVSITTLSSFERKRQQENDVSEQSESSRHLSGPSSSFRSSSSSSLSAANFVDTSIGCTTTRNAAANAGDTATGRIRQHQQQQQLQQLDSVIVGGTMKKTRNNYNFTVAICLITTDGEAYFQEWVDYHLLTMNFDAVYVYDNSPKHDLKRWHDNTRSHPLYQTVKIEHRPGPGYNTKTQKHLQSEVYEDCIQRYGQDTTGPQHDYFALIDIDEFLVPQQEKYDSIHSVLDEYLVPFGGSLVSNWVLFGSANRTVYSAVPVTKRFQYRDAEVHNVIKSIVKATDYLSQRNPHAVRLKRPDVNLPHTSEYPGAVQANIYDMKDRTKASSWVKASNVLLVYHYRYTSDKEYYYKRCIRDGLVGHWCDKSNNKIKNDAKTPDHVQSRPGEVLDDTAWNVLKRNVPKYRVYDTPDWGDFF